jgi:hypothetical protein
MAAQLAASQEGLSSVHKYKYSDVSFERLIKPREPSVSIFGLWADISNWVVPSAKNEY